MARSINPLHDRQHEGLLLWRRSGSPPLSTGALFNRGRDSKKGRPGLISSLQVSPAGNRRPLTGGGPEPPRPAKGSLTAVRLWAAAAHFHSTVTVKEDGAPTRNAAQYRPPSDGLFQFSNRKCTTSCFWPV